MPEEEGIITTVSDLNEKMTDPKQPDVVPQTEEKKPAAGQENGKKSMPFSVVEAYKMIRVNILFALSQSNKKSFVVSSFESGDGKSTSAINIAASFAQLGNRVLLIDADMRKPTVHRKLKLPNTKGLTSVLVGFCTAEEAIQHVDKLFDVLTSGPIPPNPSEMLYSNVMDVLCKGLEERYDYIVYDTPPFGIVSDALVLAPRTAGIVLIAKAGYTTTDQMQRTKELVDGAGCKILGTVLNAAKNANRKYKYYKKYYRYGHSYSYYYHSYTSEDKAKYDKQLKEAEQKNAETK